MLLAHVNDPVRVAACRAPGAVVRAERALVAVAADDARARVADVARARERVGRVDAVGMDLAVVRRNDALVLPAACPAVTCPVGATRARARSDFDC